MAKIKVTRKDYVRKNGTVVKGNPAVIAGNGRKWNELRAGLET